MSLKPLQPETFGADGTGETVNGGVVGFFSLEMSAEQLATRIIAEQTGIPSNKIRRGVINEADFENIKDISIELQDLPFYVDETGGLSIGATRGARAPPQAATRPRSPGHRLYPAPAGLDPSLERKPRAGNHGNHHPAQGARQGAQRARSSRSLNCRGK